MAEFQLGSLTLSGLEQRPAGSPRGIVAALHGGGYRAGYWDYSPSSFLADAAGRGYLAVAMDRPGYGAASTSPMPMAGQAEVVLDLVAMLRGREGALPVFIAGHSMGGILALHTAASPRAAALISAVEAGGVPFKFPDTAPDMLGAGFPEGMTHLPPVGVERARPMFFGPDGSFDEAALGYGLTLASPIPIAELPDAVGAPRDLPGIMQRITLPLRLTFAEHENSSIAGPEVIAAALANLSASRDAQAHEVAGCGHNFSLHHAANAYHAAVLDWFDGYLPG